MSMAALNAAVTAVQVEDYKIQVQANNIANANTTGFKASMVETSDLFYNNLRKAGIQENADTAKRPIGAQVGYGSKIEGVSRVLTQGGFRTTGQPLNIAISGAGYFLINIPTYPNGRGFTRDGSFKLDQATRTIVTSRGEPLDGNFTIPDGIEPSAVSISNDGIVTYLDADNNQQTIGQIQLYTFPNENGLEAKGSNLLVETDGSGEAAAIVDQTNAYLQYNLEMSNVSTVEALTDLVRAQRGYELAVRVIKIVDETQKELNSIKS